MTYIEVLKEVKNGIYLGDGRDWFICSEIDNVCGFMGLSDDIAESYIGKFQDGCFSVPERFKGRYWACVSNKNKPWWNINKALVYGDVDEVLSLKVEYLNYLIEVENSKNK